ncbi:probable Eukaryotic translation initiation factor 3 subunit C [Melanopsichium pennsylvanicum]|uniref:Eukaryotic translation initiation factor 3 subunit C n=2 Tax=Melanopsichium pennsylvanicum TaxID=63383 RepID=A0AAJ4XMH8_9BASI|nr:probable translation initiation factor eIF3 [Melanopsichium pennsylvanicum 4]SNX84567.1 probable Eukaryotic translation initiation factor 3 subunit C [Melanopsichium pennsylvanicum]
MSGFFRKVGDSDSESDISSSEEELSELESGDEQQQHSKTTQPAAGRSRFLRGSDDESDSDDSDSDEESLDSDASDDESPRADGKKPPTSRFMKGAANSDDSDSEEEVKKVVKSAKDKRIDDMQIIVDHIESAKKSSDWTSINKDFDNLMRSIERQRTLNENIPAFFYKAISQLDTFLNESVAKEKDAKKKMKAPVAKAMNGMKQKLKKVIKDNDDTIARYRSDPEAFEAAAEAATAAAAAPGEGETAISKGKKDRLAAALDAEANDDFQTVGRGGRTEIFTSEGLFKSLAAIMEARGRKSTDKNEQIRKLSDLSSVADSPYKKIRVILALVAARFDYNASATAFMPVEMWESARKEINEILALLSKNRAYVIREETPDYDDEVERVPNQDGEKDIVEVRGSIISFVDRLDDEFTKSLQNIDPHTTEYVDRLCDEKKLYETIVLAQGYFEGQAEDAALARCTMRRLDHVYAKQDIIIKALESTLGESAKAFDSKLFPPPTRVAEQDGPALLVRALCTYLYQARGVEAERPRTRAMLCHIYFHALHAEYHVARDMFLMSHLQDAIHLADVATQILYNRVVVQIGICAFRNGLIKESQVALQEIFATGRVKELLAQGVQKQNQFSTITPEQEKLERQRQLPFHMHINLELLECIYLISSMLLEVPNMALAGNDPELRKRVISRPFRRMLDYTDRQVFSGPPENTRDHIMQACKALQNGDCKACIDLIADIKIWKLMPGSEDVKAMLAKRIQEVGLRTYLFSYSAYYESVSLTHLAATFDVEEKVVKAMVSKMIYNDELAASLDPSANVVAFHRLELSKVQQLAATLADKANSMLEQNERLLDAKLGEGKEQRSGPGGERGERGEGGQQGGRRERRGGSAARGRGRGRGRAQQFQALGQKV